MLPNILVLLFAAPMWLPPWAGPEPLKVCVDSSMQRYRGDVLRAFITWLAHTPLQWEEVTQCAQPRTIAYYGEDYDGAAGHAAAPWPLYDEPFAGDVFLNLRVLEANDRMRKFILPTLVHETGHAFGMPDIPEPTFIMGQLQVDKLLLSPTEARIMRCLYWGYCN